LETLSSKVNTFQSSRLLQVFGLCVRSEDAAAPPVESIPSQFVIAQKKKKKKKKISHRH